VVLSQPIFPGYLFVRSSLAYVERLEIMKAPGTVSLLGFTSGPVAVPDWQISSIRAALAAPNPFEIIYRLVPGRRVRVVSGAVAGLEGVVTVAPDSGTWLVISVEILGRSVAIKLPSQEVKPV
jgi:transcription antitermination factor NusG